MTYVGELGWELLVPNDAAVAVYDALHEHGADLGLADAGYSAIESLRLEKGFRAFGRELTPDYTPVEAGLVFATALSGDKDFLGRDALVDRRERLRAPGPRRRLVSFVAGDPDAMLWGGELVLRDGEPGRPGDQRGVRRHRRRERRSRVPASRRAGHLRLARSGRLRGRPGRTASAHYRDPEGAAVAVLPCVWPVKVDSRRVKRTGRIPLGVFGWAAMPRWTEAQVTKLAPDDSSVTAARRLTNPALWSDTGSTEILVWGKCQGSGKSPYQVSVDLAGPAFRCSCPSRKFPCKHALALLLLWVRGGGAVADAEQAAAFAQEWADGRAEKSVTRQPRNEGQPDPVAQAKRLEDRLALMTAGLDDFSVWLRDLVRAGTAAARQQPYGWWDETAARLVDAQLPGLAEQVRTMAGDVHRREDWADHLLAASGRWWTATRAWTMRDALDRDGFADLRAYLGWPQPTAEVRAADTRTGTFEVLGGHRSDDGRLQQQRTWLRDQATGDLLVVLDFSAGMTPMATPQLAGTVITTAVSRYPGTAPRRVLFAEDPVATGTVTSLDRAGSVADALARRAERLAAGPWRDRVPVTLAGVTVVTGDRLDCPGRRRRPARPRRRRRRALAAPGVDRRAPRRRVRRAGGRPVPAAQHRRRRRAGGAVTGTVDEWWGQLRAAALVGTARRDVPPLPALGLAPRDGATREEALLDAAALGDAVRRAGRLPDPAPDADVPAAAETLPPAPSPGGPDPRAARSPRARSAAPPAACSRCTGSRPRRRPVASYLPGCCPRCSTWPRRAPYVVPCGRCSASAAGGSRLATPTGPGWPRRAWRSGPTTD